MPYNRKKKKNNRPGYYSCGKMVLSDASKALSIARNVASMINVEYKHHNVQNLNQAVTDAGSITNVSLLTSTTNSSTDRDGGQVKWTSFRLAYNIFISSSATKTLFRVMLVQDKQTNQAQFTVADLLFDATVFDAVLSPYNINNASRFNVLYDKVHSLSITGDSASIYRVIHKRLNIKCRYDANAGDVTDLSQDSLSLVFIATEATNDPAISFNYRARFVDN